MQIYAKSKLNQNIYDKLRKIIDLYEEFGYACPITEMAARKPPKLACAEELPINIKYFFD